MTQIYQNNSPVFIKVLNKKGVVKDYDSTLDQYFITYFNSKDKRDSNWFTANQLGEFKAKDVHARLSSGDRLVRFDKKESVQKTLSDGRKLYYEDSDNIKTLPDGRPLYWTDENKKTLTVSQTNCPVVKSDLVYINPEDRIDWVAKKVGEKEPEGLLPLHPATREEEYINHIKSLEKLVEGYKLVLPQNNESLNIKIKYFSDVTPVEKIDKGNWIDLRSAVDIEIKQGERAMIPLGVGMKLPEGYEANVVPRSSTFKTWGIIQTNHFGVIDNSYSGNEDQWHMPVYATRDTKINKNDRICQFRINQIQPSINIEVVENLDEVSRSGFGSTGTN